jgi:glycosyltransferase involved in cell wall biosynthesis
MDEPVNSYTTVGEGTLSQVHYSHPLDRSIAMILTDHGLRVSIVIPALNEADNLPQVLPRIPNWAHEVLLVDGNSTDGTVEVARSLMHNIRIVPQQKRGKGAALRSGFAAASGEIIVMLDADGSTDPAEIPAYVAALLLGADFAKGSRFLQGGGTADMPLYRKLGNWAFVGGVRLLFGGSYSDLCYGYNAFWADLLPLLDLDGDGFEIETMMNVRALCAGLKVIEVPSFEARRVYGTGRLRTIPDGWRVLKTLFKEWLRAARGVEGQLARQAQRGAYRASELPLDTALEQPPLERAVGEA